jgi:hypothetical protein
MSSEYCNLPADFENNGINPHCDIYSKNKDLMAGTLPGWQDRLSVYVILAALSGKDYVSQVVRQIQDRPMATEHA